MRVEKRDGSVVPFDYKKLRKSIYGAFLDSKFPVTEGDLDSITEDAHDILKEITKNCRAATFKEVINATFDALNKNYFNDVAKAYKNIYMNK